MSERFMWELHNQPCPLGLNYAIVDTHSGNEHVAYTFDIETAISLMEKLNEEN